MGCIDTVATLPIIMLRQGTILMFLEHKSMIFKIHIYIYI